MGWECRMMKKYELTDETLVVDGHTLYRIRALRSFSNVKKGDLGGYVEKERNLSHDGDCWVRDSAKVFGKACVCDNARVAGSAWVYDNARVGGYSLVYGKSKILGKCVLKFNAWTYLRDITLEHGIWIDTIVMDNKTYVISNTLELYLYLM
jgi:UDP-3-O-[3-hydroxymyristoyl] glucosamine N-acyltransferase